MNKKKHKIWVDRFIDYDRLSLPNVVRHPLKFRTGRELLVDATAIVAATAS